MLTRLRRIVVPLLAILTFWGCAEDGSMMPSPEGEIQPTLASIQEHVFTPICSACHVQGGTGALMLLDTEANSYEHLVGVNAPPASYYCRPWPRVSPGDPDNSCIVMKLEDAPGILGDPMPRPPLPRLDQEQIDAIRQWIADGANP
jgi:mono/diheme cytochrome c family protein